MAVPKRKISRSQKGKRRIHQKVAAPGTSVCPQCKEVKLAHRICSNCGYYNGKEVITEAVDESEEESAE